MWSFAAAVWLAAPRLLVLTDARADAEVLADALRPHAITLVRAELAMDDERADLEAAVAHGMMSCDEARKLVDALEIDRAVARFELAFSELERGFAAIVPEHDEETAHTARHDAGASSRPRLGYEPMSLCLVDYAAALVAKGKNDRAAALLRLALLLPPAVAPDPAVYNPDVLAVVARAKRDLARAPPGTLTIVATPPGAAIELDGVTRGLAPLTIPDVKTGEHWLVVRHPDHRVLRSRVSVRGGEPTRHEVFLRELDLTSRRRLLRWATVEIDAAARLEAEEEAAAHETSAILVLTSTNGRLLFRLFDAETKRASAALAASDVAAMAREAKAFFAPAPASSSPVDIRIARVSQRRTVHPALALLPFGVGQFMEGRYASGVGFLLAETALLALNVVTAALFYGERLPDRTFVDPARGEGLKWTANASVIALVALCVGGGVEGVLNRTAPAAEAPSP